MASKEQHSFIFTPRQPLGKPWFVQLRGTGHLRQFSPSVAKIIEFEYWAKWLQPHLSCPLTHMLPITFEAMTGMPTETCEATMTILRF